MKEIRLWQIDSGDGQPKVVDLNRVNQAATEQLLEDILVARPDLLMPDLKLVGRQTETPSGPLDLLGVDGDGRLVVFELKRGILTREAVAQILDYASFLAELEPTELSKHISERSGKQGIDSIPDFLAWYQEQFARSFPESQRPRLVLVGLGAEDRSRRIVSFLVESDLDISLVTFHAFEEQGKIYLAKQVEVEARSPEGPTSATKAGNLEKLRERVEKLGLSDFYYDAARFLQQHLSAYEWPNPSGYSYYLPTVTETGTESNRVYASLYLSDSKLGKTQLVFQPRALEAATLLAGQLPTSFSKCFKIKPNGSAEAWIGSLSQWKELEHCVAELCEVIVSGLKQKRAQSTTSANMQESTSDEESAAG